MKEDIWSLGIALLQLASAFSGSDIEVSTLSSMTYEERGNFVTQQVEDPALR